MVSRIILVGEVEEHKMRFIQGVTGQSVTRNYNEPTKYVKKSLRVNHTTTDVEIIGFDYNGTKWEILYIHRKNGLGRAYHEANGYPVIHLFDTKSHLRNELSETEWCKQYGRNNKHIFVGINMDYDIDLEQIRDAGHKFFNFYQDGRYAAFDYILKGDIQVPKDVVKTEKVEEKQVEKFPQEKDLDTIGEFLAKYNLDQIETIKKFLELSSTEQLGIRDLLLFQ